MGWREPGAIVRAAKCCSAAMLFCFALFMSSAAKADPPARAFEDISSILSSPAVHAALGSKQINDASDLLANVQASLIWAGFYDGVVDGRLGEGTSSAIKRFQSSLGTVPSGVLTVSEVQTLLERSIAAERAMGFRLVEDQTTGTKLGLPIAYLANYRADGSTAYYSSADDKARVLLKTIASPLSPQQMREFVTGRLASTAVGYATSKANWFVIAGDAGPRKYYMRFQKIGPYFTGFVATYDDGVDPKFTSALTMMSITLDSNSPHTSDRSDAALDSVLLPILERTVPAHPLIEATPLADLEYDGEKAASLTFKELTAKLDRQKSESDGKLFDPVASLKFSDGRSLDLTVKGYESESPASELRVFTLDKSRAFPQIVYTFFWQGAHCCMVTQIVTTDDSNNLVVVKPEPLDGGGYQFSDVDGDGNIELISDDNSFLYAFASYAESRTPIRIYNLRNNVLVDVTRESRVEKAIEGRLAELEQSQPEVKKSNGYIAAWVATKAQLGQFREAWLKMLGTYDRASEWTLEECADGSSGECPASKKRTLTFPEALEKLLVRGNYITPQEATEALNVWKVQAPPALPPTPKPGPDISVCSESKAVVERIVVGQLIGRRVDAEENITAVSAENDFTLDGVDDRINKTECSVTVDADLRQLVSELAGRNEMRTAVRVGQLATARGSKLSRRVHFTVQPTSKPGQTMVTVLQ